MNNELTITIYLSQAEDNSKAVTHATPPTTNPDLHLQWWTTTRETDLLEVLTCIFSTHPYLGDESQDLPDDVSSLKGCDRGSLNRFGIIICSRNVHICIDIKIVPVPIAPSRFFAIHIVVERRIASRMDLSFGLHESGNIQCCDEVASHEVEGMLKTPDRNDSEVAERSNFRYYSPASYFFWIEITPIWIKGGADNTRSYIIDRNVVAYEPAQLIKKNSE
jgi:hypothetical protein